MALSQLTLLLYFATPFDQILEKKTSMSVSSASYLLPPMLAEEVIFVCVWVCVCLFALCRINRWTYGPKIWHTHKGGLFLRAGM